MQPTFTQHELTAQGYSKTFVKRFWENVKKDGPIPNHRPELGNCWEWTGWKQKRKWPYGAFGIGKRSVGAHVASWILHFGPVKKGHFVLHKCDFCSCVNPTHLFSGTAKDNTRDAIEKRRFQTGNHEGEHNGRATITQETVDAIRKAHIPWIVTKKELAKRFNVSFHVIKAVVEYKTWH